MYKWGNQVMMEVGSCDEQLSTYTPALLTALLHEFSAVTDYRTLRDTLPRRLAALLKCRCVIIYLRMGDTLQFAAGTFDDTPGWSSSLLTVAHINPIEIGSTTPEARAWQTHHAIFAATGGAAASLVAVPLIYRQHTIGVMVAYRGKQATGCSYPECWSESDGSSLEAIAGIVALLLENTRLLERDRERIHELSSRNTLATQLSRAFYEFEAVQRIVLQRVREITHADFCELLQPEVFPEHESWVTPELHSQLFAHFADQQVAGTIPVVSERVGEPGCDMYMSDLPAQVKTFFAIPMFFIGASLREKSSDNSRSKLLGVIAGAFYQTRKMRREELVSLQVLAGQTSAALENMQLMKDVIEARNHARRLLRQVVEDQRQKELMEEENRRLDRLASLGEMSANVAHEVRNPLASIKAAMQMLKHDLGGQAADEANEVTMLDDAQESVAIVLKEVERLDAIVHDLLLFARPRQVHLTLCNLTDLCDHVLHMLGGQCAGANIAVRRMYHLTPLVQVDEGQIEQVLLNLCMNAVQAMPDGGILTVTCQVISDCAPAREERRTSEAVLASLRIETGEKEQEWLEVAVSDTGTGITEEEARQLFQPFFTTKAHGIGLGLSITRRLVEDHRGHIVVKSGPGQSTTFSVRLPIGGERMEARK